MIDSLPNQFPVIQEKLKNLHPPQVVHHVIGHFAIEQKKKKSANSLVKSTLRGPCQKLFLFTRNHHKCVLSVVACVKRPLSVSLTHTYTHTHTQMQQAEKERRETQRNVKKKSKRLCGGLTQRTMPNAPTSTYKIQMET